MERPLTDWERQVLSRLASVVDPNTVVVLDSLPHLVVTGECGCGCPSFDVRDTRYPEQPHKLAHHANGWTPDRTFGFALWLGPDDRPKSVDVFDNRPEGSPPEWPDPATLVVEAVNGG